MNFTRKFALLLLAAASLAVFSFAQKQAQAQVVVYGPSYGAYYGGYGAYAAPVYSAPIYSAPVYSSSFLCRPGLRGICGSGSHCLRRLLCPRRVRSHWPLSPPWFRSELPLRKRAVERGYRRLTPCWIH